LAASSIFQHAVGLLGQQQDMAQASSCFKAVLQMQHAHMQLALQRVLHLQTFKTPRMQPVLSSLAMQELAAVLGLPAPEHGMLVTPLGAARELSNNSSATSSGSGSLPSPAPTSSSAAAGTPWAATVAGAAAALKAGQWSAFVLSMQQEMLQAIESLGKAALAAAADAAAPSGSSSAGPAGSAEAVQKLLKKLAEVLDSVQQDAAAEMAEVLQALFNAEFSQGYGSMVSFMRGHLHQCPNGHYFVIGECGGAMQESRCVECGAAVGGRSHQLAAGNQHANEDVLQQLHEHMASARK
jgi:hypothetical protein